MRLPITTDRQKQKTFPNKTLYKKSFDYNVYKFRYSITHFYKETHGCVNMGERKCFVTVAFY